MSYTYGQGLDPQANYRNYISDKGKLTEDIISTIGNAVANGVNSFTEKKNQFANVVGGMMGLPMIENGNKVNYLSFFN